MSESDGPGAYKGSRVSKGASKGKGAAVLKRPIKQMIPCLSK